MLNEVWYPHVNMCVPAAVVWPAIAAFSRTGDGPALQRHFTVKSHAVQKLWSLQLGLTLRLLSFRYYSVLWFTDRAVFRFLAKVRLTTGVVSCLVLEKTLT